MSRLEELQKLQALVKIILPAAIKIGGLNYKIEMNEVADRELDARREYGAACSMLKRIRVRSNMDDQQFNLTFLHELVHVIDDVYVGDELSERQIGRIANGLYQVFEQLGISFEVGE